MEFYREGFLNKAGKGVIQKHVHSWRPRYFVLDGFKLKYYKSKEILPENLLGCIEMSEMESVSLIKNEKNAFQITTTAKRTYYMSGRSEDEIQGWIKCLEMAKAKYLERQKISLNDIPVHSMYDEVNLPPINPTPPTKPQRSLTDPSQSPASPTSPYSSTSIIIPDSPTSTPSPSVKPVKSAYQCFQFPSKDDQATKPSKDENLYADPTYDSIDEKAVSKKPSSENSDPAADLYDTVETRTTKMSPSKNMTRTSDSLPHATVPPPLPARLPSMSDGINEQENKESEENKNQSKPNAFGVYQDGGSPDAAVTTNSGSEKPQEKAFGLYDEIVSSDLNPAVNTDLGREETNGNEVSSLYDEVLSRDSANTTNSGSNSTQSQAGNAFGLYDEVATPNLASNSENELSQGFGLYDEVVSHDRSTGFEKEEVKNEPPIPDPTHVYAKPQKSTSLKRDRSKRKLIPGLMDVGEVDIDIEEDAAGGRETLKRGMTKPQGGERFAIEELKEILADFDKEMNNNESREMLPDFDVNQSGSAFEVLRMFLEKYD